MVVIDIVCLFGRMINRFLVQCTSRATSIHIQCTSVSLWSVCPHTDLLYTYMDHHFPCMSLLYLLFILKWKSQRYFDESLETLSVVSPSHGVLSRLQIFKFIGPSLWISLAHNTPSYDTKMLLKVNFDKTAFVKFKISNNLKQNIDDTHSKQPKIHRKIHTSLWILKILRKIIGNQKS